MSMETLSWLPIIRLGQFFEDISELQCLAPYAKDLDDESLKDFQRTLGQAT